MTFDFYHSYRAGEPQGQATGGYCAVGATLRHDLGALLAAVGGIGLIPGTDGGPRAGAGVESARRLDVRRDGRIAARSRTRARAQVMTTERGHQASPQHFALELRFGPYKPDIDSEFDGRPRRTPYKDFFGSNRRLMTQIEFDYQIIRHVGSLGSG